MEEKILTQKERVAIIKKYLKSLPEGDYEIMEHNLAGDDPTIYIQTSLRTIGIGVSDKGKLIAEYKMRRGKGSKSDFEKRLQAYNRGEISQAELLGQECQQLSLDQFLLDQETEEKEEAEAVKEHSEIKAENSDKNSEKETNIEEKYIESATADTSIIDDEVEQKDIVAIEAQEKDIKEGIRLRLKFKPERIFTLVKGEGNIYKVRDDSSVSYNIAKSDLEPVMEEG